MPIVSVILPVYNAESFLHACIDSILAQSFTDFELICVNDGSKDSSAEILQEYANRDPRVKLHHQDNAGVFAARNAALELAQGEFIQFTDADDAMEPQMLEIMVNCLETQNADMAYCLWKLPREATNQVEMSEFDLNAIRMQTFDDGLYATFAHHIPSTWMLWFKMFRASIIEGLRFPEGKKYKDLSFLWDVLLRRPRVVRIDEPLYHYTENPESLVGKYPKSNHFKSICDAVTLGHKAFVAAGVEEETQRYLRFQVYHTINYMLWFLAEAKPEHQEVLSRYLASLMVKFKEKGYIGSDCYLPRDILFTKKQGGDVKYAFMIYLRNIHNYRRIMKLIQDFG